jgi:hypothetical protein
LVSAVFLDILKDPAGTSPSPLDAPVITTVVSFGVSMAGAGLRHVIGILGALEEFLDGQTRRGRALEGAVARCTVHVQPFVARQRFTARVPLSDRA